MQQAVDTETWPWVWGYLACQYQSGLCLVPAYVHGALVDACKSEGETLWHMLRELAATVNP